ncbi:MAG: DUF2889 domain-containing protein [Inquilinaceae bacterium]
MPLTPTDADRDPIHTRTIECRGYRRRDGLWDIEGRLTDIKGYPFENAHRGTIEPGDPLHAMAMRLTVDDDLTIVAVEAVTDKAPYGICDAITPRFQVLEGLAIRPGFQRRVKELLGGVKGCTHLVDLLGPMATTAFQTIYPLVQRQMPRAQEGKPRRPTLLNSCHAYASDGDIVRRQWPDFYTGGAPDDEKAS